MFFTRHERSTLWSYALRLFLAGSFVATLYLLGFHRGGVGRPL